MSKVRVGWLQQDIGMIGGAEMSCASLIKGAPEWAEVVLCPHNLRPPRDIDVFVIQNCVSYGAEWIQELALKPVVKQVRDPWYAGSAQLRRWLLDNADLLIFSSNLQLQDVRRRYPFNNEAVCIPVPVNLEPFRDATRPPEERRGAVFVGRVDIYKGAPSVIDWAIRESVQIAMIGDNRYMRFGQLSPNVKFVGPVAYEEMPAILGAARYYVTMPTWVEAFGRSVVEAWAAGCELVIRGSVGAQEWITYEPERLGLEGPVGEFWSAVEGVL